MAEATLRVRLVQGERLVIPSTEIADGRRVLTRDGDALVLDRAWVRRTIRRGDLAIVTSTPPAKE